jgi:hypothetical protein
VRQGFNPAMIFSHVGQGFNPAMTFSHMGQGFNPGDGLQPRG